MTAYCLWDVRTIHDQDAMNDYVARVTDTVTAFGGEYVVVGGPWQIMEGDWRPSYPVLITFPSIERAHEWYASDLYAPLRDLRFAASSADAVFFDGVAAPSATRATDAALGDVVVDLYRDVHKGIRRGLFQVVEALGNVDPFDDDELAAVHGRLEALLHLLDVHAAHEDEFYGPMLERHLPALAERLERDHADLDVLTAELRRQMPVVTNTDADGRRLAQHRLYLTASEFVAAYLEHQITEEAVVLPAINAVATVDEMGQVAGALVASITPGDMAAYLQLIVPAVNPIDLVELYDGMRAGAPPEVFDALLGLAGSVLPPAAFDRLTSTLTPV